MGTIKTAGGKVFDSPYAGSIGGEERAILYIQITNSNIADVVNVFSNAIETKRIEYREYEDEEPVFFEGFSELYGARIMPENGDVMINLERRMRI